MTSFVPNRSAKGCLTCKKRRKKCDETKPICQRCTTGGFHCLGYGHLDIPGASTSQMRTREKRKSETHNSSSLVARDLAVQLKPKYRSIEPAKHAASSVHSNVLDGDSALTVAYWEERDSKSTKGMCVSPSPPADMVDLIVSRYVKFMCQIFRPFSWSFREGLTRTLKQSSLVCSSTFIGSKIMHDTSNRTKWENWYELVRRLHQQALNNPGNDSLEARLTCCHDLSLYLFLLSKTSLGYSMFKRSTPMFLELADDIPNLGSSDSTISLHGALASPYYGASRYSAFDTILSVVFAVPPSICYDTASRITPTSETSLQIVESVYGWPVDILLSLGRVNAWRVSQWTGQVDTALVGWQEIQAEIERWRPSLEYVDEPANVVGRFAIYEAWRQAALIYLYMGMCLVNSADPRVEAAVRQVVQLVSAIGAGTTLERHTFIPSLIAGAAARLEKHRAMLRSKLLAARDDKVWILPGPDMVSVLDHLWHGVGADGAPTTWEDYVNSRCEALPLGNNEDVC